MIKEFLTYFIIGIISGSIYFSALWISIRLLPKFKQQKTYLGITTLIRLVLLLTVFYFIITSSKYGILYALVGFVISRFAILKFKGLTGFSKKCPVTIEEDSKNG